MSTQEGADLKTAKGTRQKISPGANGEPETVIYVEPLVDGSTPTALGFKRLEQSVIERTLKCFIKMKYNLFDRGVRLGERTSSTISCSGRISNNP